MQTVWVSGGFITLAVSFTVGLGVLWLKDSFAQGDYFVAMGMNLISVNHNYLGKPWVYKPTWISE